MITRPWNTCGAALKNSPCCGSRAGARDARSRPAWSRTPCQRPSAIASRFDSWAGPHATSGQPSSPIHRRRPLLPDWSRSSDVSCRASGPGTDRSLIGNHPLTRAKLETRVNLIEPWWKVLRSLALKGRRFETWAEIEEAVRCATEYWNRHKHPFAWGRRRRHRTPRRLGIATVPNALTT